MSKVLCVPLLLLLLLLQTYGRESALKWFVYWRLFYLACSELFNFNGGEEWGVGHYLFVKPAAANKIV
jgi:cyclopropane-fatty-acyl-phospholipid synthase